MVQPSVQLRPPYFRQRTFLAEHPGERDATQPATELPKEVTTQVRRHDWLHVPPGNLSLLRGKFLFQSRSQRFQVVHRKLLKLCIRTRILLENSLAHLNSLYKTVLITGTLGGV